MPDYITSQSNAEPLVVIAKIASPPPIQGKDGVVLRFYLQSLSRALLPDERVAKCLRALVPGQTTVDVMFDSASQVAHYRHLITCSRLWFCPVCATRITEQRAAELLLAVTSWHEDFGFVALLTFTLRHNKGDKLEELLGALRAAHRRFKSGKGFVTVTERYGWQGSVTALEVTHGDNGWHPHLHELVFFDPMSANIWHRFEGDAKKRWLTGLAAEGKDATWENGLDVRTAESDVYDYVAKFGKLPTGTRWTIEREVAKSPVKRASGDGRTPFQLLLDYGNGDELAGSLYQEYARVFKGRNQLNWSRGLRDRLELGVEAADDDIAPALDEYVLLASLSYWHWKAILALESDVRGDLLAIASLGDRNALAVFLASFGVIL